MTLIIAAQGKDFLILGADSRGTIEDIAKNRLQINMMTKLYEITNRTGILVAGAGDQAIYLIDKFKKQIKTPDEDVTKTTEALIKFCRDEFKKTKDVPVLDLPAFTFIIAGLDKIGGIFVPYCNYLHSYSGFIPGIAKHGYVIKGKPLIAEYLFTKHYDEEKSVNDMCELVALSISDTISVDGDVGGQIQMAIIDREGFREYSENDVESFIQKNTDD